MKRALAVLILFSASVDGQLNTSATSAPVNDYQTQTSLQGGSTATLTSATAKNKRLVGFEVWTSVRYKALLYTINNAIESTSPAVVGGAPAFETFQWRTPAPDSVVLGSSAGNDAFELKVTNLDPTNSADIHATFHYSN